MTSKERAKLKSVAANTETIFQIGKNPLSEAFVKQIKDALAARELIKIRVLETCEMLPMEFAQEIADRARCEVVQVIGSRVVLFRKRSKEDKKPSLLDEPKQEKQASPKTEQRIPQNKKYGEKNGVKSKSVNGKGKPYLNGGQKKTYAPKKQVKRGNKK
ncbi:MAG: YhbY family RNA-binding protein [Ruminiclostridium sp.]|nr:YhbY family RNA-binding protein [Ruminiclostridium sp.]